MTATDKRTDVWSRDFMIWRIIFGLWAVAWAGQWEKRVWADYEQLLRPIFSLFWGQRKNFKFKKKNWRWEEFFFSEKPYFPSWCTLGTFQCRNFLVERNFFATILIPHTSSCKSNHKLVLPIDTS